MPLYSILDRLELSQPNPINITYIILIPLWRTPRSGAVPGCALGGQPPTWGGPQTSNLLNHNLNQLSK